MKKILLTITLTMFTIVGFAQTDIKDKLSTTTQMFLDELNGKLKFSSNSFVPHQDKVVIGKKTPLPPRIFASPDTIDGKVYISCFLRLVDSNKTKDIEVLGVQVQCKFQNGLVTALIPVDKILEVAANSNVKRINVSKLMRPLTNAAREATNVDDILSWSDDARAAGLSQGYDGKGVLLGVIDDGIDFQHIAFKDKNGNSRIKRAYIYNGSKASEDSIFTDNNSPTTDDKYSDHGTHTSTTAGGSSVIINGSNVTVTDDHAHASYGGMAPGADLYLAGIKNLSDTYISNAFGKIIKYADDHHLPVVVSNSWGSQIGPHDGTGDFAEVTSSYFGDNHPNHVCLFASSNDGANPKDGEGGGYYLSGTASSNSPLRSIMRCNRYTNTDAGYCYDGIIANAWCRSTSVKNMVCKIHVIDHSKKDDIIVVKTVTVSPTENGATVAGLSNYFSGSLIAYKDYIESNKTQILLYAEDFISRNTYQTTVNGEEYYNSNYSLAVEFYPSSGSAFIDVWGGSYGYFTDYLNVNDYSWKKGNNDMSVSDEATYPDIISIGAYVTKNSITDYTGTTHDYSSEFTIGDIADFSSYATAANSPTGQQYPWITAPGARLVAGVNHYSSTYTSGDYKTDRVNNNTTYPYAAMQGTSMATPTAAGIVALWLQAAKEVGKNMTVNDIKEVMRETAINDYYTTSGPNASHFGHGKIDALAGIQYILGVTGEPTIMATPATVSFEGYATLTYTKTINVKGIKLDNDITVTLNDDNQVYTIDKTNITVAEAANGIDLTLTWTPTEAGQTDATITLSSMGAETVTINISGMAEAATPTIMTDVTLLNIDSNINENSNGSFVVSGRFLNEDVKVTLTGNNNMFTVSPSTIEASVLNQGEEVTVTVTFRAAQEGSYTGQITLSSEGAAPVTISLNATATDGGTATDGFLNIAKYATIDDAGWNTTYVNKLYAYNEDENKEFAWLTMPVYGAWVGVYYDHPQKWIESSVGKTISSGGFFSTSYNTYNGVTWNASSPMLGTNKTYFNKNSGEGRPRAMGVNSGSNTNLVSVAFYVTNTTEAMLYGLGRSGASSTYPASITVYECTKNADGSVTASTTALKKVTNTSTSTSTPYKISVTDLDKSKIYKVEVGNYCGYMYEVAFKTPLKKPIIGDINRDGLVNVFDVTALIEIILKGDISAPYTFPQYDHEAADVNQDGNTNVFDVTKLIDIILKKN